MASAAAAINPLLLASACSGDREGLNILLNSQLHATAGDHNLASVYVASGITPESLVEEVTGQRDTALHAVATNGDGDNFSSSAELIYDLLPAHAASGTTPEELLNGVTFEGDTALHAVASNGDNDDFLWCADLIYSKAKHLLFAKNKRDDTPLHLAARAGNLEMVYRLIGHASESVIGVSRPTTTIDASARLKRLLRMENKLKETALHEAVRIGCSSMVELLMEEDLELARFPQDGASPLYLAISLGNRTITLMLYAKSGGILSYSGPNGQNALHAAVGWRRPDLTKLMLKWNKALTTERDENGSTPLHFAAGLLRPGTVCRQLMEANPTAMYQSDKDGLFPVHVAVSVRAYRTVAMFVNKCPGSAGLLDAKGRTFLHVAAEKKFFDIVHFARRNRSLSWILNIRDKDGNTALHLAVQAGSLRAVCALLMNLQVEVNLRNDKGHTPLDVSRYKTPPGLFHDQNSRVYINRALMLVGAGSGASRVDHFDDNRKFVHQLKSGDDESRELQEMRDSTQNLSIGSVLIATVTFGATFALPGGYRADDHVNGGAPTLAGRYAFDAFMIANTISFVCSSIATIGFMHSGTSLVDLPSRKFYFAFSAYLMRSSISSLTTAFALAAYMVLAPVAHKTAIATCVLASLVVLSSEMELWAKRCVLARTLCARKRLVWTILYFAKISVTTALTRHWPIIFSFGFAIHRRKHHPVPTMLPPPLA